MLTFNSSNTVKNCGQDITVTDQGLAFRYVDGRIRDMPQHQARPIQRKALPMTTPTSRPTSTTSPTTQAYKPIYTTQSTTYPRSTSTTTYTTTPSTDVRRNKNQAFGLIAMIRHGKTREEMIAQGYPQAEVDEFLRRFPRPKRDLDASEEETADLQFSEHHQLETLRHLARSMCAIQRQNARYLQNLISQNPTTLMRKLLKRRNIIARTLSEDTMEIEMCTALKPEEYAFIPNPNQCSILVDIKTLKKTYSLDRTTHILSEPQKTPNQTTCGPTIFLSLNDTVYEYDRATGKLSTSTNQSANLVKDENEDQSFTFLDNEVIFRDLIVHHTNTEQELLLRELEKATEKKTHILIHDQDAMQHHNLEELLEFGWMATVWYYVKRVWVIWVTLAAMCETYQRFFAFVEDLRGRRQPATNTRTRPEIIPLVTYNTQGSPSVNIRRHGSNEVRSSSLLESIRPS
ncbi:unnamed protein product [Bursaphelenchus okinawaensis]|uniref:Uncharacterized protein n=1 Tax=Bursaphelenchus okinawaensis TaxID=465554 RepID=A0A811KCQ3_9BILA|nr:unnamed protein product [Bursaphelenchus okinawaensis]CAG9099366.1 unnamed protein product [Bursaphelenchus okinawaensis]